MSDPETKKQQVESARREARAPAPQTREERGAAPPVPELDFASLDLRVEVVEERISPGETNVFDK
ncbi:MAG: hypothetical protein JNK02_14225 [Planctomycetes bacterium]|nr:hypothetical protein [Planctomycetota bacterium]